VPDLGGRIGKSALKSPCSDFLGAGAVCWWLFEIRRAGPGKRDITITYVTSGAFKGQKGDELGVC